jgi:hypothetical protein
MRSILTPLLLLTASGLRVDSTHLKFIAQPKAATAGILILPPVVVTTRDTIGQAVLYSGNLTIGIGVNPSGGALIGTRTVQANLGLAIFRDLIIDRPGSGYTLVVSGGSFEPAETAPFDVLPARTHSERHTPAAAPTGPVPGAPIRIGFVKQPSAVAAGENLRPVQVMAYDASGNPVSNWAGSVTISLMPASDEAHLSGAVSRYATPGGVIFSDLIIDRPGTYTLRATASGLGAAISESFTVGPNQR